MMKEKVILSTPITHSDWMWGHQKRIGHGEKSVRYILDRCKGLGMNRVYWRCFDGGLACYHSQLMDSLALGFHPDNYHAWMTPDFKIPDIFKPYRNFDSLKAAVNYGHKIGLEVHAWLTINEDDHGWGLQSRFTQAHPQFRWIKRNGTSFNSQLSFAFPEVRKYKLGLVKEILRYDVDGFFFDWMRTGDVRGGPQADSRGTADFGYEPPLVEGFKAKFKKDPRSIPNHDERWVQFRCEPQSLFVKEAHKLIKQKNKSLPIAMMGHHPWSFRGDGTAKINGNRHGLLLDVTRWAKEGWVDEVTAAGYFRKWGTAAKAYAYLKEEVKNYAAIWLWWWMPSTPEDFTKSVRVAQKLGSSQILYWESDYVDAPGRAAEAKNLLGAMSGYVNTGTLYE
jgi:uncharacterized lipoprotein YddW (UPF0748 family)